MNVWEEIKKRVVSKKYQAWGIATWLLWMGKLSEENWLILTLAFLGADVAQTVGIFKKGETQ